MHFAVQPFNVDKMFTLHCRNALKGFACLPSRPTSTDIVRVSSVGHRLDFWRIQQIKIPKVTPVSIHRSLPHTTSSTRYFLSFFRSLRLSSYKCRHQNCSIQSLWKRSERDRCGGNEKYELIMVVGGGGGAGVRCREANGGSPTSAPNHRHILVILQHCLILFVQIEHGDGIQLGGHATWLRCQIDIY